ncbi:hypothetical protein NKH77_41070 [Streptomyces sp. M19]
MTVTTPSLAGTATVPAGGGRLRSALRSRRFTTGLAVLAAFALTALIGPWLTDDPHANSADLGLGPSGAHWLGTTQTGEDVFAQLVVSTRGTLLIGVAAALIATAVSVVVGIGGGFLGGIADETFS